MACEPHGLGKNADVDARFIMNVIEKRKKWRPGGACQSIKAQDFPNFSIF